MNDEYDRSIRSEAPSPDERPQSNDEDDLDLPRAPSPAHIVASTASFGGRQPVLPSGAAARPPRPSRSGRSRRGRTRRRRQHNTRRRSTPSMMRSFLARGAEQERCHPASEAQRALSYQNPNNSPETPVANTPATVPADNLDQDFSLDSSFDIIADRALSSNVYHVTATYYPKDSRIADQHSSKRIDTFGIWRSFSAAREAAEQCSQLPMFRESVVTIKTRPLSSTMEESYHDRTLDGEAQDLPSNNVRDIVEIEIVEYSSYVGGHASESIG